MRDALVTWLRSADLSHSRVYLIVRDAADARRIADEIGAEVVVWSRARWEAHGGAARRRGIPEHT